MSRKFRGWGEVAKLLTTASQVDGDWLDKGQRDSLNAISERIVNNGLIIADEVGMGKTRIAVEVCRAVTEAGGRVAVLVPTGLGFQWQDEFSKGQMQSPPIVRSYWGYLKAWGDEKEPYPWYQDSVVIIPHTFSNWHLGNNSPDWRWGILPAIYGYWKKINGQTFPWRFHHCGIDDPWVHNAAQNICERVKDEPYETTSQVMSSVVENYGWHTNPSGRDYVKDGKFRSLLHNAVGMGFGEFDLVVVDEAHKSRGDDSGLSRLLTEVILQPKHVRRISLTATPVELGVEQWIQTLNRIGVDNLDDLQSSVNEYADAVRKVRTSWASSESSRDVYFVASKNFQEKLSPYLIRRDKRMDLSVVRFRQVTGESYDAYRKESEILISPEKLPPEWRRAICAAESLSFVSCMRGDPSAKRLRLTMGSGHGIATHLDKNERTDEDIMQEEHDVVSGSNDTDANNLSNSRTKRHERAAWWRRAMTSALSDAGGLYDHPAILAAIDEIEKYTQIGHKVLVFGRFTAPLRALTELLNAREIIRCMGENRNIPQEKVHESEGRAMSSALKQLGVAYDIAEINAYLEEQYR